MNREQANLILDQLKVGIFHPLYVINQALTVTGDLRSKPCTDTQEQ
jgi:hypothetical protein